MKTKTIGFKVKNGKRTETFYQEPKQETLEEVAERYYEDEVSINGFVNGAKWQQEQDKKNQNLDKILQKIEEIKIMINVR